MANPPTALEVESCPPHHYLMTGYLKTCLKCNHVVDTEPAVRKYLKQPKSNHIPHDILSPRKKTRHWKQEYSL